MARFERNMLLLSKQEATAGTDAVPTTAADAVLAVDAIDISPLELTLADRNLLLPYFGGSAKLLASYNSKVNFGCELAGSGTAGTSAPWAEILLGCAASEVSLTTPARIETTPASTGLKTLTNYLYDDGVLHKVLGWVGNAKLSAKLNQTPRISFEGMGTYVAPTAVTFPSNPTLTMWKQPVPINKANVIDITIGCTYAAGVLTGGTVYPSQGIEMDLGNKYEWVETLKNGGRGEVTNHDAKCSFQLELTAAEEVQAYSDMLANTLTGIGFTIGSAAGAKIILFSPQMQRVSIKKGKQNGIRFMSFEGVLTPLSGNDDWRIVQL